VAQLRRHRLLDDDAFARYWVEQRQTYRPRGARLLRAELVQRGIPRSLADEATAPLEPTAEDDAYRAAARHAIRLREPPPEVFEARLRAFLARRGFDWDTITSVVRRLADERFGLSDGVSL
jgi:regulatory protein